MSTTYGLVCRHCRQWSRFSHDKPSEFALMWRHRRALIELTDADFLIDQTNPYGSFGDLPILFLRAHEHHEVVVTDENERFTEEAVQEAERDAQDTELLAKTVRLSGLLNIMGTAT